MTTLFLITAVALISPAATEDELLAQARQRIERVRMGDVTLRVTEGGGALPEGTEVTVEQTRHAFLFGANIFVLHRYETPEQNTAFEKLFSGLFNYATAPFYWWGYEAIQGKPNDDRTTEIVNWCKAHHIICKGHPLAWNFFEPSWLSLDPLAAMKSQFDRIEKCTEQWAGQIDYWDVVNEATHYDRPNCEKDAPKLTTGIRQIGVQNYVRQAFEAARLGNAKAHLIINDYETGPEYAAQVIDLLVDAQGKPLYDIIGIQCHQHGAAWSAQHTWDICERFAKYGKPLHFTEATIVSGEHGWELPTTRPGYNWTSTPEGEAEQAREVVRFYTMLFSHPAVEAITWWDPCDQHAWQGAPAGLIRKNITPKPAYDELKKLIKGAWWTKTRARVGADGTVRFRGFYGDYRLLPVAASERKVAGSFSIAKEKKDPVEVRLAPIP